MSVDPVISLESSIEGPLDAASDSERRFAITESITIAFVIHSMRIGGAERSIARLVNALDPSRFKSVVICLTVSGPAAGWIECPDVPVIEIRKSKSMLDRSALRRLTRTLVEHRVDIVHSHNWGTLLETTYARRRAGVTAHVHAERGSVLGHAEMRGLRMWLRGVAAGWALRKCDAVVTNARSVAKRIEERCGFPAQRVQVIGNGVEAPGQQIAAEKTAEQRKALGIEADDVVLGSVGRLVAVKGFDIAVRALAALAQQRRRYHLLLVGDGPELEPLRTLAESLGVRDQVHFTGYQENVELWLSLMDIYFNSSRSEGMSQSLVEALAAGRPVIATDVGDSAEVLGTSSACGRLIPADNVVAFTEAVVELSDPNERLRIGTAAADRHSRLFSSAVMARNYEILYRNLIPFGSGVRAASKGGSLK